VKVDSEKTAIVVDNFDRLVNDHKINCRLRLMPTFTEIVTGVL